GAPAYVERLRGQAKECGVDFVPRRMVTDEELVATLNRASVMLYAPRLEPFGLAPLEANACGVPVVAVAEGGVRETVIDGVNGVLVEPRADAMAEGIVRLMRDSDLRGRLGRQGRHLVAENWSVDA